MGKRRTDIDENQIKLSDNCDDLYETKYKENDKVNDESKNKIDYDEKLKEVDELKEKVNELTCNFTSLQKTLEEFMKANSQPKSNQKTKIINDRDEEIRTYTKTRTKFDRNSGQIIVYAEELTDKDKMNRDIEINQSNEDNEKRSNYTFNVDRQPDMIVQTKDKNGEDHTFAVEEKMKRDNNSIAYDKYNIKQNELSILKNKGWISGVIGALMGGIPGAIAGGSYGLSMFNSNCKNEKTDDLVDRTREFLVNHPVKDFDEFVERIIAIDPNVNDEALEFIKRHDDIDYYNKLLLDIYNNIKSLEQYKLAKTINETEDFKYGIPYVKMDFTAYNISNNLRKIMKDRNISQEQMAELIGVSRSSIVSILNNRGTNLENAFKISRVLGLSIEEIFNYEPMIETITKIQSEINIENNGI